MSHPAGLSCLPCTDPVEEDGMTITQRNDSATTTSATTSTARVPLEHPGSLLAKLMNAYSRRQFGLEAEPTMALLHQPKVLTAIARFGMKSQKWSRLDSSLKELACLAVASQIGCSWCMDFGYYMSRTNGMAIEKLEDVAAWRDSAQYTPLERKV